MPLRIRDYIAAFPERFPFLDPMTEPWKLTADLSHLIERFATSLDASAFRESAGVLVHHKATIEPGAIIKPPAVISAACFIASTAYLRGGVVLDRVLENGMGRDVEGDTIVIVDGDDHAVIGHFEFVFSWHESILPGNA